jgi:flagellar export protein FliJ
MQKFQFKLKALEKIRKSEQRSALQALAQVQSKKQVIVQEKQSLIQQIHAGLERREILGTQTSNSSAFRTEDDFIIGNKYRLLHADHRLNRIERELRQKMSVYLECRKKLKMVEKLRERAWKRYQDWLEKQEQKEADEMNIMRARFRKEAE